MTEASDPPGLSGADTSLLISRLITRGVVVLVALAIISGIQMFRVGASERYALMITGCVLSVIALFAYPARTARERGEPQRTFSGFATGIAGFIPYVFGCYLVFYEGFWRLRLLLESFSVGTLVVSLLYIVGGYAVVSAIHKASEFSRAVDEGRLRLS